MQINKELLERALVEGVDVEDDPDHSIVSLATIDNKRWAGFHSTMEGAHSSRWEYVCTLSEYLKAKAEKEKMQEFKVGDLVCVTHKVGESLPINRHGELKYISKQTVIICNNGNELIFSRHNCELKPHRKTQDWFGVEIDAFMTEKPKDGKLYYPWNLSGGVVEPNTWHSDNFDSGSFDTGIWDNEEKAKRSVPIMRKRLAEMAGVSCKEK